MSQPKVPKRSKIGGSTRGSGTPQTPATHRGRCFVASMGSILVEDRPFDPACFGPVRFLRRFFRCACSLASRSVPARASAGHLSCHSFAPPRCVLCAPPVPSGSMRAHSRRGKAGFARAAASEAHLLAKCAKHERNDLKGRARFSMRRN